MRDVMEQRTALPPVGHWVERLDSVDSTNSELKRRAAAGAPHGMVLTAGEQTGGRGRMGRSFVSPRGKGLYFSLLLRPEWLPQEAVNLTAWTAVAVCRAIEKKTGLHTEIKWTNDILLEGKKLCGILTEMQTGGKGLEWVIVGIGINLDHAPGDLPDEVAAIATSLGEHLTVPPTAEEMTGALIDALREMTAAFPGEKDAWLEEYRSRCITPGREVEVHRGDRIRRGLALELDEDFRLVVRFESGMTEALESGEVSVKGLY